MSIEAVLKEIEELKPAFILQKNEETKKEILDEYEKRIDLLDSNLNDARKEIEQVKYLTNFNNYEIAYLDILARNASLPIGDDTRYKQLTKLLEEKGFEYGSKKIAPYILEVSGFEENICFCIAEESSSDIKQAHEIIKQHIKPAEEKEIKYGLKIDQPEEFDECGMSSRYTIDLLKDKRTLSEIIKEAKEKCSEQLLSENEKYAKIKDFTDKMADKKIQKEPKKYFAMKFLNECGYCEPSLSEIRSKNFLKNVASKANKKLAELKKDMVEGTERYIEDNLNLIYNGLNIGFSVYHNRRYMWKNIAAWTPEAVDEVIKNFKAAEPLFNPNPFKAESKV